MDLAWDSVYKPVKTGKKKKREKLNHIQWRTKILGNNMENLTSTSLTYQIIRCSVICTFLTTWIPRMALPSPLQTMLG